MLEILTERYIYRKSNHATKEKKKTYVQKSIYNLIRYEGILPEEKRFKQRNT